MQYQNITSDRQLVEYCKTLSDATVIAFDTEFVSEDSYRPELCLVQVAAAGKLAVIDTMALGDVTPLWEALAAEGHETVVHAGREELCFSLHAIGKAPNKLFDIQLAAAMIGLEYPAAYGTVVYKMLGATLPKGETRTNWRRRPLSNQQIEYALEDIVHLEPLRDLLTEQLQQLGRLTWLEDEMRQWQKRIESAEFHDRWRKLSGVSNLSRKALAIVRELWKWRDRRAEQSNRPPRRVLRDDLMIELSKRGSSDPQRIRAIRGMERRDLQRRIPEIAACVQRALELPKNEWPAHTSRSRNRVQFSLLGQFLATALSSICRDQNIAPGLVGTVQDVRDLVAYRLDSNNGNRVPALMEGWRAEVVGRALDDVLAGRLSIRVADPLSDQPLELEDNGGGSKR